MIRNLSAFKDPTVPSLKAVNFENSLVAHGSLFKRQMTFSARHLPRNLLKPTLIAIWKVSIFLFDYGPMFDFGHVHRSKFVADFRL